LPLNRSCYWPSANPVRKNAPASKADANRRVAMVRMNVLVEWYVFVFIINPEMPQKPAAAAD
jgi:hypothetical protein